LIYLIEGLTGVKMEPAGSGFSLFVSFACAKETNQRKAHHENQPKFFLFAHVLASKLKKLRFALFVDTSRTCSNELCRKLILLSLCNKLFVGHKQWRKKMI
jgi:hypothetical protein